MLTHILAKSSLIAACGTVCHPMWRSCRQAQGNVEDFV